MNIQIFGTKKSFDSKKAERYFKERGIKYQFIDMKEKGLSKGDFDSVCQSVGGLERLEVKIFEESFEKMVRKALELPAILC
jgi:arsenate reductase-like glutaredoxin family protein